MYSWFPSSNLSSPLNYVTLKVPRYVYPKLLPHFIFSDLDDNMLKIFPDFCNPRFVMCAHKPTIGWILIRLIPFHILIPIYPTTVLILSSSQSLVI